MRTDTIEINGYKFLVKIHHEIRKDSTASISPKAVNIRIPLNMNREDQFRQLLKMKSWAIKKLGEDFDKFKPKLQKQYNDGDIIAVGNANYKLSISFKNKNSSSARIIGDKIYLIISSNLSEERKRRHISTLLSRCIARARLPKLQHKIGELNKLYFNQKMNKVFFKHNKSNWGSCSEDGNINVSTRLLFAPDDILEYVCVHELAHLIEHNHSDRFWKLVENAMPSYKEKINWLKENGHTCSF
ncbi:M48 family metallopeptidase [Candidatus Woesearchaeota archaeon]|nr:M48 family metallopeptidase [Candidatus Woesearchaeota archaeon]